MLKKPKIEVNLDKLKQNLVMLSNSLSRNNIQVAAVTKVFSAHPRLVALYDSIPGIRYLADSRIENIKAYPETIQKETMLLRIPMVSQVEDVVQYCDISLNSELETIRLLDAAAGQAEVTHKIILMVDLGDLREGVFDEEELISMVESILDLDHIQLLGLGTNLTCYGGIIPKQEVLDQLVGLHKQLEADFNIQLPLLSGGNSSSLYLLDDPRESLPEEVNMLRIGEAFVLGRETAYGQTIDGMHPDAFLLKAEIVEYKEKPSYPIGPIGMNAFGEAPHFEDKGMMKRGIIALGRQDADYEQLIPLDSRLEVIGSSSDHMIIDFTQAADDYRLGSEVSFRLTYGSLLSLFTSKYVAKEFI